VSQDQRFSNCGGRCWSSGEGGARFFYEGHIYFERNVGAYLNTYFGKLFVLLKYKVCFIL
jgi:hypothetical protein